MDVKQTSLFQFNCPTSDPPLAFGVTADSRDEACHKLITALQHVISELNVILKSGAKPN